jgi:hypothetical protein
MCPLTVHHPRRPGLRTGVPALILLLLLGAFTLRIAGIRDTSLWQDEAAQIDAARAADIVGVLRTVSQRGVGAVPLDHILTWVALRVVGEEEFALRYIPLMWSVITVALLYLTGETLQHGTGKWVALVGCLSPLAIAYAREARFYSLALMFATAVVTVSVLAARGRLKPSAKNWLLLSALTIGTIYSHVYSTLLWVAGIVIIIFTMRGEAGLKTLAWYIMGLGSATLMFAFWFFPSFNMSPHALGTTAFGVSQLNPLLKGLEVPPPYPVQPNDLVSAAYPYLICLLFVVTLMLSARDRMLTWIVVGLTTLLAATAIAVCAINLLTHYFFAPRQFLFLMPERALILGIGLWLIERRVWVIERRTTHIVKIAGMLGIALFVASAVEVTRLNAYAANTSVAEPAVKYILQHYDRSKQDLWMSGIGVFALDYYVNKQHEMPLPWKAFNAQALPKDRFTSSPTGSLVVLQRSLDPPLQKVLGELNYALVWPAPGQYRQYDIVIYAKAGGVQ